MEKIALLGCTGSIGTQVLNVVNRYSEKFKIEALVAGSNAKLLNEQVEKFKPAFCGLTDIARQSELKISQNVQYGFGENVLGQAAAMESVDTVIIAVSGMCGLSAVLSAINKKKKILLASKEVLVAAGELVMNKIQENDIAMLPIDSEHSAIFQCLQGYKRKLLKRVILTASGGPFLNKSIAQLEKVKLSDTLKHPNWNMGKKITVDSATLMNKGLEVIEAKWLFDLKINEIDCIIHPQSIIHSMVEYVDNSVLCQMSYPTMEIPIQFAMTYPDRCETAIAPLDFKKLGRFDFFDIDADKFPCFKLAKDALRDNLTLCLNSANEVVVAKYLEGNMKFTDIPKYIECSMNKFHNIIIKNMDDVFNFDREVRKYTLSIIPC